MKHDTNQHLRIGAVNYLNSKPLIEGLAELAPEAELMLDYPSRLADRLSAGTLDVALVPSIACLLEPDYEVVSDACVAARGPVLSVKLYFRKPPAIGPPPGAGRRLADQRHAGADPAGRAIWGSPRAGTAAARPLDRRN